MQSTIQAILEALKADPNPYFDALLTGEMTREDFIETQVQFFSPVMHFHHPMRKLAARIPPDRNRDLVLKNVSDELGNDDPSQSHENTFLRFLNQMDNLSEETVRSRPSWDDVKAFNASVDRACTERDYRHGAAFMGMMELMFSQISGHLGRSILRAGWLREEELVHYTTHEALDIQHAQDFFSVVEADWETLPEIITAGLEEGAACLDGLYRDLYTNRKRRIRE